MGIPLFALGFENLCDSQAFDEQMGAKIILYTDFASRSGMRSIISLSLRREMSTLTMRLS